jgi:adenylosuccinate lyase
MLFAISPVDGRYASKTKDLQSYFSEFALIKYRVLIEIEYFISLCELPLPQLADFDPEIFSDLRRIINRLTEEEAEKIKAIERTTNHDVKAVEYYIKEKFDELGISQYKEFVHFGLTSQDINNTAIPLSLQHAIDHAFFPQLEEVYNGILKIVENWDDVPMLARTHGQPASPTRMGKEMEVFISRIKEQARQLRAIPVRAKFGGATGNFNAHFIAYPDVDWHNFANQFIQDKIGLQRAFPTTQIEHYDNLAAVFHAIARINTILLDLCRDMWTYISMDYFKQKTVAGEVGSSAMPHKVNPIDFENAEGNIGIANALLEHLAAKLPVSRLQRDLTDSTVLRNIGVPFAHTLIAYKSIVKGLSKVHLNQEKLDDDLNRNWAVVSEAIQTILRREGYDQPYEALKALTRGKTNIQEKDIRDFIETLSVSEKVKEEMRKITPQNYVGK